MKCSIIPDIKEAWSFSTFWIGTAVLLFGQLPEDKQLAILASIGLAPSDSLSAVGAIFLIGRLTQVTRK